jgi:hypothetical protein
LGSPRLTCSHEILVHYLAGPTLHYILPNAHACVAPALIPRATSSTSLRYSTITITITITVPLQLRPSPTFQIPSRKPTARYFRLQSDTTYIVVRRSSHFRAWVTIPHLRGVLISEIRDSGNRDRILEPFFLAVTNKL